MKKKFFVAACVATMVMGCAMTANAADLQDGLVGYYTFDDTLENSASSTGGSAKLHGGAGETWNSPAVGTANYAEGKNGKAYEFLGDQETRGEGLELDAKITGSDFTISTWVNATNFGDGTTSMLFAVNTVLTQDDACFSMNSLNGYNGSVLFGKIWDWGNRNDTFVCLDGDNTGTIFTTGKWVHVTITGKSGEQKLYLNGNEYASSTSTNDLVVNNLKNAALFLGINWWDKSFAGLMDDVLVYDRVLSADEVKALYENNGSPIVDSGTVDGDASVYAQYKKEADGEYTVRVVAEVGIADLDSYAGAGFRCTKTAQATASAEAQLSTVVFKSIMANGSKVEAADGNYFIVTEIKDVPADGVVYVRPSYTLVGSSDGAKDFVDKEYTINMANIVK